MNVPKVIPILRARVGLIATVLLLTMGTALVLSLMLPKTYKATTTLVLNYKGVDPVTGFTLSAQLMPGYMSTQVDIVRSKNVALKVVEKLGLANDAHLRNEFQQQTEGVGDIKQWIAERLLKEIDVSPMRESAVLGITAKANTPEGAATIANAFTSEYQNASAQIKAEPIRRASLYFDEQISRLREVLEQSRHKISRFQQEKGISNLDSRYDLETARLNDLSSQLAVVQGQLIEAESRQNQIEGTNTDNSPDIVSNPLIQTLKATLAQAEARLSQLSADLTPAHPRHAAAIAEVNRLRAELRRTTRITASSVVSNANIQRQREAELRAAVESQKTKVLELNYARNELAVLVRGSESAERAYDAALQRFNQTSLEGQANQTDVAVLNPAVPPEKPSSPRLMLNMLLSGSLGLMLGLALALFAELLNRRVRGASDLALVLDAPVLCVIKRPIQRLGWRTLLKGRDALRLSMDR